MTIKNVSLKSGHTCKVKRSSFPNKSQWFLINLCISETAFEGTRKLNENAHSQLQFTLSIHIGTTSAIYISCRDQLYLIRKRATATACLITMAKLEELTRIFKELGLTAEKQQKQIQLYQQKAQHLTIGYLVFQAIAFISITNQALSVQSQNWWIPFTLSLLSSLIYFLAFLSTASSFYQIRYRLHLTSLEQEIVYKQIHEADQSHKIQINGESSCSDQQRPVYKLLKRKICITMTISAFGCFCCYGIFRL